MMNVDDVGPPPGGGDVAGGDFLGAECPERKGAGDEVAWAASPFPEAPDGHDLGLMPQCVGTLGQIPDHALHAARARPVVFGEV